MCGYLKTRYKKLFTHVESHASAVSILESGEQRYIKAINNNNNNAHKLASMWLFQYVHTTGMENTATFRVTRSVPDMLLVIITEERLFRQVSHISSCFYGLF